VTYWFLCQGQEGVLQLWLPSTQKEHPHVTASCDDYEFTHGV
jgi:hypothetical protein